MTLFNPQTFTFHRYPNAGYVAGHWVLGEPIDVTVTGTKQPGNGDSVATLMEGKRITRTLEFYVNEPLLQADPKTGKQGDRYVDENGDTWEIITGMDCQNGIIPHYEYTAIRDKELG